MPDHAWRNPLGGVQVDDAGVRWLWRQARLEDLRQRVGINSEGGRLLTVLATVGIRPGRVGIDDGTPLSAAEAARTYGCNIRTVTRACKDGRLVASRNETNGWEIPPAALNAWQPRPRTKPDQPSTRGATGRA